MNNLNYSEVITCIAKRIRAIRESRKITVQELAYRCEMERSNISRIESGRVNITIKTLCIIASSLNVPLIELIADGRIGDKS